MRRLGSYDGSLSMYVEEPRVPSVRRLEVVRKQVEGGNLEHKIAGPSAGYYADNRDVLLIMQPDDMYRDDLRVRGSEGIIGGSKERR
ncbi:hypothetical protein HYW44_01155 [Candidatus Daviesbacteria bacterium]|nr:hypothetical protein [Candidatus Daviesbacteria bacterium]